jgi:hypothetical protein
MQILLMFDARLEGCGCWQVLRHESRCNTSESAVNVSGGIVFNVSECAIVFCITKASLPKLFQIKPRLMLTRFNVFSAVEHHPLTFARRCVGVKHSVPDEHRHVTTTAATATRADAFHPLKTVFFASFVVVSHVLTALQKRLATRCELSNANAMSRLSTAFYDCVCVVHDACRSLKT